MFGIVTLPGRAAQLPNSPAHLTGTTTCSVCPVHACLPACRHVGSIPVSTPCGPHITRPRGSSHTRGVIWKFSVARLQYLCRTLTLTAAPRPSTGVHVHTAHRTHARLLAVSHAHLNRCTASQHGRSRAHRTHARLLVRAQGDRNSARVRACNDYFIINVCCIRVRGVRACVQERRHAHTRHKEV